MKNSELFGDWKKFRIFIKAVERRTPRSRKHTKMKKSNQGIRNFFKPTQTRDEVPVDRHPTNESPKTSSVENNAVVFSETPNQSNSSIQSKIA